MVFACISLNNLIFIIIITNLRTTFLARVIAHIADGKLSQVSVLNHCYLSKDTSEVIHDFMALLDYLFLSVTYLSDCKILSLRHLLLFTSLVIL